MFSNIQVICRLHHFFCSLTRSLTFFFFPNFFSAQKFPVSRPQKSDESSSHSRSTERIVFSPSSSAPFSHSPDTFFSSFQISNIDALGVLVLSRILEFPSVSFRFENPFSILRSEIVYSRRFSQLLRFFRIFAGTRIPLLFS